MPQSWVPPIPARWYKTPALLLAASLLQSQDLAPLARAYRNQPSVQTRSAVLDYANARQDASGALALLVLGSKEAEEKQFDVALSHLSAAAKRLPALADYPAFFSATARYETENYNQVERALKPVWDRTPASPLLAKSVTLLANAFLKLDQPKKASALVELHRTALNRPEAELLLARAAAAAGDHIGERLHYERLLVDFPASSEAAEAASEPDRLAALLPLSRLTRAIHLLDRQSPAPARRELEQAIPNLTGQPLDRARVRLGVAQYMAGAYAAAYDWLRFLDLASGDADAERLYYVVRCARRLDHPQDFKKSLDQLAAVYPQSPWHLQALLAAGDYYFLRNDARSYEPIYLACASSHPTDPQAAECHWRAAWAAYRAHRPAANALFLNLITRSPAADKVPNAIYFLARIAESANDFAAARAYYEAINAAYPNFFYATLARQRLTTPAISRAPSAPATAAFLQSIRFPVRAGIDLEPSAITRLRFERSRLLASAGLDDLAENELRFAAKADGQPEIVAIELADLATARDAPDMGIRYIKQLIPNYLRLPLDTTPGKFWKLAFPLPFRAPLEQYSREHKLDPFLVAALIRQESEFNPKIVSHANAYGLTQLLPSTARELARKLKLPAVRNDMLFTPELNLRIGTFFLRSLLDRLQGQWEATLASYNAGPGRVAQWLTWADFREPAEFVETIPYDETRNYVQSVLRNADLYRRLYAPKPVALASTDGSIGRTPALP